MGKMREFHWIMLLDNDWCPWRESNPHSLRNTILSRARLPVPPHGPLAEHDPFGKLATTFPDRAPGAIYIFGRRPGQKENQISVAARANRLRGLHPRAGSAHCSLRERPWRDRAEEKDGDECSLAMKAA
jgi:hypothetical protein